VEICWKKAVIATFLNNIHQERECKIMEFNKNNPYRYELDENFNILIMLNS
jgi:hypothetical protein